VYKIALRRSKDLNVDSSIFLKLTFTLWITEIPITLLFFPFNPFRAAWIARNPISIWTHMNPYEPIRTHMDQHLFWSIQMEPNSHKKYMLVHMGSYQSILVHMDPYGSRWVHMDPYRSIWINVCPHGPIWIHMDPYWSLWIHMGPYGSMFFNFFPFGNIKINVGPYGFKWVHMGRHK